MKKHISYTIFALSFAVLAAFGDINAQNVNVRPKMGQNRLQGKKVVAKPAVKRQALKQAKKGPFKGQSSKGPLKPQKAGSAKGVGAKSGKPAKPAKPGKQRNSGKTAKEKETAASKSAKNQFLNSIQLAQRNLRPVTEQEKNAFAKSLAARRDQYDAQADMGSLIKKLRLSDDVIFKNSTNEHARLEIQLSPKNSASNTSTQCVTVAPGEQYVLNQNNVTYLQSVKLLESVNFLNLKMPNGKPELVVESTLDRNFLHQYHGFEYASRPFSNAQVNDPNQTEAERIFKEQFNGAVYYMRDVVAPAEGLTLQGIDEHRQKLFAKNNIAKILERDSEAMDRYENKIPLITHKIWVTSNDKPVSLPNYYLKWFENSIEHNPTCAGWTHFLWIESKEKLPELAQKLANHPNIKIMELKDMPLPLVSGDLYKEAIENKQFGKATDILRLEILKQFGGFYLDTDYELFQSLKPYSKVYDMVVAVEPMSPYLCNAFIGACPDHPVVDKCLEMIIRNMNPGTSPDYVKNAPNNGFKTILETGPIMLTNAFALAGGKHGTVDIAMPPMLIYPTPVDEYPKQQVVKPGEAIPAEAIGAHYWETAWMRAEFGSAG